jgi:hypothetical protein
MTIYTSPEKAKEEKFIIEFQNYAKDIDPGLLTFITDRRDVYTQVYEELCENQATNTEEKYGILIEGASKYYYHGSSIL